MNPIYKFELQTSYQGVVNTYTINPLRKSDLTKDYEMENGERFYRAKLNGKLTFVGEDYALIYGSNFETQFLMTIRVSYDGGENFSEYWKGEFFKTDCKFNDNNHSLTVTPSPVDGYAEVLAGLEKEFNLIELKPEIERISVTKRPLIQLYVPGETVVSCFLSNMYWEQDCNATEESELGSYYFRKVASRRIISISGRDSSLPQIFKGAIPSDERQWSIVSGEYTFSFKYIYDNQYINRWTIEKNGQVIYTAEESSRTPIPLPRTPYEKTFPGENGVSAYIYDISVYGRVLLDVDRALGEEGPVDTYHIPAEDMAGEHRNYYKVMPLGDQDVLFVEDTTSEPTEWGIKNPGEYYEAPHRPGYEFFPVGRSHWGELSIWFSPSYDFSLLEPQMRKHYILRDTSPISSVISVLLNQIAPGITHEPTPEYSHFLYDNINPLGAEKFELFLTQKSNVLSGDYTQPAQKAPIMLKYITDMLKNCFCAYWYIEDNKFKIEHISWFKNGGNYYGPSVFLDLTSKFNPRNGKSWSFDTDEFEYEKEVMPERYQFKWMDEATKYFDGEPIVMLSRFVKQDNTEERTINNFTSDIDYMLLNPGGCSQDGFALLAAVNHTNIKDMNYTKADNILTSDRLQIIANSVKVAIGALSPAMKYRLAFYDGDFFIGYSEWKTQSFEEPIPGTAKQASLQITTTDGSDTYEFIYSDLIGSVTGLNKHIPIEESDITLYASNIVQNPYAAMPYLQDKFWKWDLPSGRVKMNGQDIGAQGIMRGKKQVIRFPLGQDPSSTQIFKMIKTGIGSGEIKKLSINLQNRNANATLMFDTYSWYGNDAQ